MFGSHVCTTRPVPNEPAPRDPWLPADLLAAISYFTWGGPENRGAAPPCDPQAPLGGRTGAGSGAYPALGPLP